MKKPYLLLFTFFFASAMLLAQKTSFNKKITNKIRLRASQIVATENDGFLIMGSGFDPKASYPLIQLAIKANKNGNIKWCKKIVDAGGAEEFNNGIALKNGNYLVEYYVRKDKKRYLTMFDNTFVPIWTLQVGLYSRTCFTELSDGNIAATGYFSGSADGFQVAILNPISGAVVWVKRYESLDATVHERAIRETNDGQLLISIDIGFQIYSSTGKRKNKLLKINRLDGGIIWQKELTSDFDYSETIQKILEDKSGNLYLHFYGFKSLVKYDKKKNGIVKLDKDANIKWLRTYGDSTVFMSSLLQKKDGSLLAVIDNPQDTRTYCLNLNQDGDIVSQSSEFSPSSSYYPESSCFTNDGSLIMTGYFGDCISATTIYLRKRASDGKGNCSESSDLNVINDKIVFSN